MDRHAVQPACDRALVFECDTGEAHPYEEWMISIERADQRIVIDEIRRRAAHATVSWDRERHLKLLGFGRSRKLEADAAE